MFLIERIFDKVRRDEKIVEFDELEISDSNFDINEGINCSGNLNEMI